MQKVKETIALAPRSIVLALALIILLIVIRLSLTILALAFVAVIIAAALEPWVMFMERHRVPRIASVLLVFLGFFVVIGLALAFVIPLAIDQATGLAQNLPSYQGLALAWFARAQALGRHFHVMPQTTSLLSRATTWVTAHLSAGLATGLAFTRQAFEALVDAVIVILLAFFFLMDAPKLRDGIIHLFPAAYRPKVRDQAAPLANALGNYVRGQLISMAALAVILAFGLWLVHEPYPWLIAVLSGALEIVPWLGGAIGVIVGTLIALTVSWKVMLLVWVVFGVAHVLQGDILGPYIQSKVVQIHPAIILISLLIGAEILGILGAIIAVPLTAMIYVLVEQVYVPMMDKQTGPLLVARSDELPPAAP